MVNRKGVIRIIEVLIAITIISIVLLIVYRQNVASQETPDLAELARDILGEISTRENLRDEIMIHRFNASNMANTLIFINNSLPDYISYELRSCQITSACGQSSYVGDVFSAERIISASKSDFNPVKLRLFIWVPGN